MSEKNGTSPCEFQRILYWSEVLLISHLPVCLLYFFMAAYKRWMAPRNRCSPPHPHQTYEYISEWISVWASPPLYHWHTPSPTHPPTQPHTQAHIQVGYIPVTAWPLSLVSCPPFPSLHDATTHFVKQRLCHPEMAAFWRVTHRRGRSKSNISTTSFCNASHILGWI